MERVVGTQAGLSLEQFRELHGGSAGVLGPGHELLVSSGLGPKPLLLQDVHSLAWCQWVPTCFSCLPRPPGPDGWGCGFVVSGVCSKPRDTSVTFDKGFFPRWSFGTSDLGGFRDNSCVTQQSLDCHAAGELEWRRNGYSHVAS